VDNDATSTDRERDLDRLLTFVDAVVAIAITLLVLPLVELTSDVREQDSVADLLRGHQPQLWSFLLSFLVIARLWFAQHRALRHLVRSHPAVSALLVFWTLTIVVLPFPTALVAQAGHQTITKVLYLSSVTLSTVAVGLMARVIARRPQLTDGRGVPDAEPAIMSAALLVAALVVMLAVPATSYFPLLLLFLDDPLRALRQRWLRGR
jgi:uncharacterized membrane protein